MKFMSNKGLKCAGQTGYLLPFGEAISPSDFSRRGLKVQLDVRPSPLGFPADTIRPCREFNDHTTVDAVACRVIIIGPDIDGSTAHIGQYALTMPFSSNSGLHVHVRFSPTYSVRDGLFWLSSLCRSRNVQIEGNGFVVDPTAFS